MKPNSYLVKIPGENFTLFRRKHLDLLLHKSQTPARIMPKTLH
jgi:hypothetical protein